MSKMTDIIKKYVSGVDSILNVDDFVRLICELGVW